MRYFIVLQYNGKNYHGWQIQPNEITVQEELDTRLSTVLRRPIRTIGAGRTDTGVHANHFVAHFDFPEDLKPDSQNLIGKLNKFLPPDISIQKISQVKNDAHARFDATARTYKYYISRKKSVFQQETSWQLYYPLDLSLMQKGSSIIKSYRDFTSFSKLHSDVKTNNCQIMEIFWEGTEDQIIFTIKADRFLRNMVRAIVGTLVELGRQKIDLHDLKDIIESKNRSNAGESVPAKGLFLHAIFYPYTF